MHTEAPEFENVPLTHKLVAPLPGQKYLAGQATQELDPGFDVKVGFVLR